MKHILLAILLVFTAGIGAQTLSPFQNIRHSSVDPDGFVHLRYDVIGSEAVDQQLFYSSSTGGWQEAEINLLDSGSYEALVPYSFGDRLYYRFQSSVQAMGQAASYLHSAWLENDTFPPPSNAMALIGEDPIGDPWQTDSPNLDITASYVACSEDKFYRAITNASGAFPLLQSFSTYNFYGSMIMNPETLLDSMAYAMIYTFNIPGLISPGLYKIGIDLELSPSFERIGDVQSTVSDGVLYLSCNFADLAADPAFGPWPNATNLLLTTDLTAQISIDFQNQTPDIGIGDYSTPGLIDFNPLIYEVMQNTLPELELITFNETTGIAELRYTDLDGDIPLAATMAIEDGQGGYTDIDMSPIFNADSSISFIESINANTTFSVSDNLIDYVTLELPVSNAGAYAPAAEKLACSLPNPLHKATTSCEIQISGLSKEPLQ
ncbi:MAG: T9SS C-terminal target domain-containing protein, partial [Candidatus Cloacimonetes bacterium]|nr:T9SS C-terminal target domain-containing protein [Candidatus Cloacimonadota bacterium]MCK9243595.1 T9SS C-terminal target domain-containing protein [Candidatus Cloacimonadota bacterium]